MRKDANVTLEQVHFHYEDDDRIHEYYKVDGIFWNFKIDMYDKYDIDVYPNIKRLLEERKQEVVDRAIKVIKKMRNDIFGI